MQNEIIPVKINLTDKIGKENNLKLYVLSDVHLGDAHCNIGLLKTIIKNIQETPNMYCVLLGDILNTALKNSKSDIYSETMNVATAQKMAYDLLCPIKDKIIGIVPGNHENRVWRETGVNISLWLADKLGITDKYRNEAITLSIKFGSDIDGNPFCINIFGQHGAYGTGRKIGTSLSAIEDMDGIVNNADCYIRAHTHQQVNGSRVVYAFNQYGNIDRKVKFYYNSPSLLDYGGYGMDKGYKPGDNSPAYINIRAVSSREDKRTIRAFKMDKVLL